MSQNQNQFSNLSTIVELGEDCSENEDMAIKQNEKEIEEVGSIKPIITTGVSTWNFLANYLSIDMHSIMCHGVASLFKVDKQRSINIDDALRKWECLTQEIMLGFGYVGINMVKVRHLKC